MIDISFNLSNPFSKRTWKCVWARDRLFGKNSVYSIGIERTKRIIGFSISWLPRQDHTPFDLELSLLGCTLTFGLYDISRHRDDVKGKWEEK